MGQDDILKLLAKRKWVSSAMIAENIEGMNINTIGDSLRRLIKGGFIIKKKCGKFKHGYLYHINDGTVTGDDEECE